MKKKLTGKAEVKAKIDAKQFLGVCVDICNPSKPFKSCWYANGKSFHLGYFSTAELAAIAFNKKAKDIYTTAKLAKQANRWNVLPKN